MNVLDQLINAIASVIQKDACDWFFDENEGKLACAIGSDVLLFTREEDESISIRYQNVTMPLLFETSGWAEVNAKLAAVERPFNPDERRLTKIRIRVLTALAERLAEVDRNH
jgi:hypothetical protein